MACGGCGEGGSGGWVVDVILYCSILFVDLGSDAVMNWTRLRCIGRSWSWGVFKGGACAFILCFDFLIIAFCGQVCWSIWLLAGGSIHSWIPTYIIYFTYQ